MTQKVKYDCVQVRFFFNDTATTEIYTLSLHDALPISVLLCVARADLTPVGESGVPRVEADSRLRAAAYRRGARSEEHTSELQSRQYLVCRLLLEKKQNNYHCCSIQRNFVTQVNWFVRR